MKAREAEEVADLGEAESGRERGAGWRVATRWWTPCAFEVDFRQSTQELPC
jgi:hypothetical protein